MYVLLVFLQLYSAAFARPSITRSFTVDYQSNSFLKDGKPFRYISGSMHYFRIPYQLWEDRLHKAKMAGLNTIQTYVAWNRHAIYEGVHDFTNDLDLVSFIQLVEKHNMTVILRPGPYIDSEWEYGGFPYWLVKKVPKVIRTADPDYLALVDEWFSVLLPKIKPLLYTNGGPIIGLQLENEYGSYGCDPNYLLQMENLMRKYLGEEVYLFTTDTIFDQAIQCGSLPSSSVYTTIDFGAGEDVNKSFALQRKHQPQGPYVNSEFYTGWFDNWGQLHHTEQPEYIASALDRILAFGNASVNLYLFEGGTNYNFMNGGSYIADLYLPITTSYDFDAPLNEAGDPTEKYWQIQKVISKYNDIPSGRQPSPSKKLPYMKIPLEASATFFILSEVIQPILLNTPASFEFLDLAYGYMWYQTQLNQSGVLHNEDSGHQQLLDLGKFRDSAYVYSNSSFQGMLSRNGGSQVNISISGGDVLAIIVENEGRTCFSEAMQDVRKGIVSERIELNGVPLSGWLHYRYGLYPPTGSWMSSSPFDHDVNPSTSNTFTDTMRKINLLLDGVGSGQTSLSLANVPGLYRFHFKLDQVADTYLKLNQWEKGVATINEIKVLKYWTSAGPQKTLYIPRTDLIVGDNQITLTEFVHAPTSIEDAYIELVEKPIYD